MGVTREKLEQFITIYDLKRLESYAKNLVDFHLIMDLVPTIARLHFAILPPGTVVLSYVQAALLVGMGLQYKTIDQLQDELKLQANQLLPLFNKAIRKFAKLFKDVFQYDIVTEIEKEEQEVLQGSIGQVAKNKQAASSIHQTIDEELKEGEQQKIAGNLKDEKDRFIKKHAIKKSQAEAISNVELKGNSTIVSIPRAVKGEDDSDSDVGEVPAATGQKKKDIRKLEWKMR